MLFTRTNKYNFSIPREHLRPRLVGSKVTIQNLDFEVMEDEHDSLSIVPPMEDIDPGKTLPITEVALQEEGNKTRLVITSKMRRGDSGGPIVIVMLCAFLFLGSFLLLYVSKDPVIAVTLCSFSLVIFVLFLIRMQVSYFNHIRKIHSYIKFSGEQITSDVRMQLFKHKVK